MRGRLECAHDCRFTVDLAPEAACPVYPAALFTDTKPALATRSVVLGIDIIDRELKTGGEFRERPLAEYDERFIRLQPGALVHEYTSLALGIPGAELPVMRAFLQLHFLQGHEPWKRKHFDKL